VATLILCLDGQQVVACTVAYVVNQKVDQMPLGEIDLKVVFMPSTPGDDELRRETLVLMGKRFPRHGAETPGPQAQLSPVVSSDLDLQRLDAKG
jgi:hypothetical protein